MSTATPGADQLQALISYSNNKTGASDTTLSDAVTRLVTGYGGGGSYYGAEYVLNDETEEASKIIWHGTDIPKYALNGIFSAFSSRDIPIEFPDKPTLIRQGAFYNAELAIKWSDMENVETILGDAFRMAFNEDHTSDVVRMPQLTGVGSASAFPYVSSKFPATYIFEGMTFIPSGFFSNIRKPDVTIQFGSIGCAVEGIGSSNNPFVGSTSAAVVTVTIYTTAEYIDAINTRINSGKGSGSFTFVYKASEATVYNGVSYAAGDTINV